MLARWSGNSGASSNFCHPRGSLPPRSRISFFLSFFFPPFALFSIMVRVLPQDTTMTSFKVTLLPCPRGSAVRNAKRFPAFRAMTTCWSLSTDDPGTPTWKCWLVSYHRTYTRLVAVITHNTRGARPSQPPDPKEDGAFCVECRAGSFQTGKLPN